VTNFPLSRPTTIASTVSRNARPQRKPPVYRGYSCVRATGPPTDQISAPAESSPVSSRWGFSSTRVSEGIRRASTQRLGKDAETSSSRRLETLPTSTSPSGSPTSLSARCRSSSMRRSSMSSSSRGLSSSVSGTAPSSTTRLEVLRPHRRRREDRLAPPPQAVRPQGVRHLRAGLLDRALQL
jgi:hypothetical protein